MQQMTGGIWEKVRLVVSGLSHVRWIFGLGPILALIIGRIRGMHTTPAFWLLLGSFALYFALLAWDYSDIKRGQKDLQAKLDTLVRTGASVIAAVDKSEMLKRDFGFIVDEFRELVDSENSFSLYSALKSAGMDKDSFLDPSLNIWVAFTTFYSTRQESDELPILRIRLHNITRDMRDLLKKFYARRKPTELTPEIRAVWRQFEERYNYIIASRLKSFFVVASQELHFEGDWDFNYLPLAE